MQMKQWLHAYIISFCINELFLKDDKILIQDIECLDAVNTFHSVVSDNHTSKDLFKIKE
jgi:hypothetical protein